MAVEVFEHVYKRWRATTLNHHTGIQVTDADALAGDAWAYRVGIDNGNVLTWGPYESGLIPGQPAVLYVRAKVARRDTSATALTIQAHCDYTASNQGAPPLAVPAQAFSEPLQYQWIAYPFAPPVVMVPPDGVEFYTWGGSVDLWLDTFVLCQAGVEPTTGNSLTPPETPSLWTPHWTGAIVVAGEIVETSYRDLVLADGPVGFWPLQEPIGPTVYNQVATGSNGTLVGGVILGALGPFQQASWAAQCDGHSGAIAIGPQGAPALRAAQTVEAWINPNPSGYQDIVALVNPGANVGTQFRLNGTALQVSCWGGTVLVSSASGAVSGGQWHHVAWTYQAGNHQLFVDGQVVAQGFGLPQVGSPSGIYLGNDSQGEWFNGQIAWVALYAQALSPSQIARRFRAGQILS